MRFTRFLAAASCALALCQFTSCSGGGAGSIEAVNPTVAEMDRLDVQWGLQPRKGRGTPRRSYSYPGPMSSAAGAAPAPVSQPAAPAQISPEPPASNAGAVESLR